MIAHAKARYMRVSPTKVRLMIDQIRGKNITAAQNILMYGQRGCNPLIKKVLDSAVANAKEKGLNEDQLFISRIIADQGPSWKRWRAAAFGRATQILKKTTHLTLELDVIMEEKPNDEKPKRGYLKAKARKEQLRKAQKAADAEVKNKSSKSAAKAAEHKNVEDKESQEETKDNQEAKVDKSAQTTESQTSKKSDKKEDKVEKAAESPEKAKTESNTKSNESSDDETNAADKEKK